MFSLILPIIWVAVIFAFISKRRRWTIRQNLYDNTEEYERLAYRSNSSTEAKIYRLASQKGGTITVSDVIVALGISSHQAEEVLQEIVDNQRVRMEVLEDGLVVYEFPELKR